MMIRPFTRVLSGAIVVLALTLVAASPVQAAPLDLSRWTAKVGSNLLDGAFHWLNGFLAGKPPASRTSSEKGKPTSGTTTGDWSIAQPNTGSCIDPQGNPCIYTQSP